ncbi:MAG: hypothetical protein ACREML_03005, partial [Vulcanimicrobiaceae bacterium]
ERLRIHRRSGGDYPCAQRLNAACSAAAEAEAVGTFVITAMAIGVRIYAVGPPSAGEHKSARGKQANLR